MKFKMFLTLLCYFTFISIKAQTCCSGGIPLSNNIGLATHKKGTIQIGLNYDYNNLNTLNTGTKTLNDNSRLRITHSSLLNAGYSITNNLSAEVLFTWINQRRKITQFGNKTLDQTSGFGDGIVLLKYNFLNAIGKNSAITIGLGSKIPIGSTTNENDIGIPLNADLQPGSNAWDIIYWSQFAKSFNFRPTLNVSSRIIYRRTGENNSYLEDSTYKFGNEFQAFFGASDQFFILNTLSNPSLFLKYRNVGQDSIDNFDLENTGGDWVFIIPNFAINVTPNIILSAKAELPIYSNVDGTQLTPTYRISAGILLKINPKPNGLELN